MNTVAIFKPGYNHKDMNTHICALATEGLKTAPWQGVVVVCVCVCIKILDIQLYSFHHQGSGDILRKQ